MYAIRSYYALFRCVNGKKVAVPFTDEHFYLRGSVEYTNPQVTVEETQGVIGTRLLETCANYYFEQGLHQPNKSDVKALTNLLKEPSGEGYIVAFLLNTDDVEPDRYSRITSYNVCYTKLLRVAAGKALCPLSTSDCLSGFIEYRSRNNFV